MPETAAPPADLATIATQTAADLYATTQQRALANQAAADAAARAKALSKQLALAQKSASADVSRLQGGSNSTLIYIGLGLAAVGVVFFLKRKKR